MLAYNTRLLNRLLQFYLAFRQIALNLFKLNLGLIGQRKIYCRKRNRFTKNACDSPHWTLEMILPRSVIGSLKDIALLISFDIRQDVGKGVWFHIGNMVNYNSVWHKILSGRVVGTIKDKRLLNCTLDKIFIVVKVD